MAEREIQTRCCIAGGGPAGIMLGYLLARAGIDVVVLEKWPDFFRDFRGDTIHPSTMDVLHELGLLDDFLKLPHNEMTKMTLHFGKDEATVADFAYLKARTPFIAFIPQWDFLNFLSGKARQFSTFHVRMQAEATGLIEERGTVVGARAKDKDGAFEVRADLTIGADGRHSTIREVGGFAVEEMGVPIDVLWFRVGRSDADDKQSLGYLDRGRALVMLDRRDYWQCAFIIQKGSFERIKADGLEAFRNSVGSLSHLSEAALAEVDSWDKVKLLSVSVDHARQWCKSGVLLIGDAAHAMSPMGGVGINYAIQDAVAAANILIPAFKKGDVSLRTLRAIQERREKPTRRMQKVQVFLQDHVLSPLINADKPVQSPWFIKLFAALPLLRAIPARIVGFGFRPEHVSEEVLGAR